jgi:hypothetical protein
MTRLRVSDHAVLRTLERICGVPVEPLREAIAQSVERAARAAEATGGGVYLVVQEHQAFVARHGTVTTVLSEPTLREQWVALFDGEKKAG